MTDPGFPSQHVTRTAVESQTTVNTAIRFDSSYVQTIPGIVKIVCIVFNLIGFICIEVSSFSNHKTGGFFNSVAMIGFWFTGIMLVLYLFHVLEKFYKVPWLKIEMIFCMIWTLLYLIASSLAIAKSSAAYSAAAFFGFCAMVAYGYDAFIKYTGVKAGEIAQGQRSYQSSRTVTTA